MSKLEVSDLGRHHEYMLIEQTKKFMRDCRSTADCLAIIGTLGGICSAITLHGARGDRELYDFMHQMLIAKMEEKRLEFMQKN